jgi:hypothetical protein
MSTNQTDIHFVLDRSGSMWDCKGDTMGGFNSFLASQREDPSGECCMSLHQFDHEYITTYANKSMMDVENLTDETFVPRGQTALLDAIGRTIKEISDSPSKKIIVILTDGEENSSREYTYKHISDLISMKEKDGWQFMFLGANQDAIQTASGLGIRAGGAMTYAQTPQNVDACFRGLSSAISRNRSGEDKSVAFSAAERSASQQ